LQNLIYSVYYNGAIDDLKNDSSEKLESSIQRHQNLENNTLLGVDVEFYDRLHEHNTGIGYFDPGWVIIGWEDTDTLIVKKGDIRLHIDPGHHLHPESRVQVLAITDLVSEKYAVPVLMPKNRVQNGFYVAVGNAGMPQVDRSSGMVRIYFNLTTEGAVLLMQYATQTLNQSLIPFSFKVLYNPLDYQRPDAGVLYFSRENYPTMRSMLQSIDTTTRSHLRSSVPLFTKPLAPGIGLAEEPEHKSSGEESFGMHRCRAIAQGLLAAHRQAETSPQQRLQSILQRFSELGIDPRYPYLNSGSSDQYAAILCQPGTYSESTIATL
jgi:hypothetical protein